MRYEVMFIVRPDMEEAEIKNTAEEMKKVFGGKETTIVEEKAMGQRELAYEVKKYNTGYYFLFVVDTTTEVVNEFDRLARISENVIRHLVVRVED